MIVLASLVPFYRLATLATVRHQAQPQSLSRFQQLNAATITCVPQQGVTQGQALDFPNAKARELFPAGYTADYADQSRQFGQDSSSSPA